MAKVFRETGEWFLALPEKAEVDMYEGYSDVEVETCGSPACFGGWLAVKYGTPKDEDAGRNYRDGAYLFAEDLGFDFTCELKEWAEKNPKIWGNQNGYQMFNRPYAFNEGDKKYDDDAVAVTTKAIGEKLIAVAGRLSSV